jgi:hypothetical protein
MGSCRVAQTGLKLPFLLPLPLKCWDYRHAPPHWAVFLSGEVTPSWCTQGWCSCWWTYTAGVYVPLHWVITNEKLGLLYLLSPRALSSEEFVFQIHWRQQARSLVT